MSAQDQPTAPAAAERLKAIAEAFAIAAPVRGLAPLGSGNVNDTYRVEAADGALYVLQRLNTSTRRCFRGRSW